MSEYLYFPILKTKPSEMRAYCELNEEVKDALLPIIEMTGARSYTYNKNCKNKALIGTKRPGDINTKIKKILDTVGNRKFILDITDDASLRYDGIEQLQNTENGYDDWIKFLIQNEKFKSQVIPTIQFNTDDIYNTFLQIEKLTNKFDYMALKIPGFIFEHDDINDSRLFDIKNIVPNDDIQSIIDAVTGKINKNNKLIVLVDFGYIKDFEAYKNIIESCISKITNINEIKSLIFLSSSFPSFVRPIEENEIEAQELKLFKFCYQKFNYSNKILHGDFASIHPIQYQTNGGGWIPRIDYICQNSLDLKYCYKRAESSEKYKNDSDEYFSLAQKVLKSANYSPIQKHNVWGDIKIKEKAVVSEEGKSPSFWISVRANLYMTRILDIMNSQEYNYPYLSL